MLDFGQQRGGGGGSGVTGPALSQGPARMHCFGIHLSVHLWGPLLTYPSLVPPLSLPLPPVFPSSSGRG